MATPLALIILDGFGDREATADNAVAAAQMSFWPKFRQEHPSALIDCSGLAVGLPEGLMGNSEVGHMNLGAGRIVRQDIVRIDASIEDGSFYDLPAFVDAVATATARGGRVHLLGLLSDGGVHSSDRHWNAWIELARRSGLTGDQLVLHAFLDGRDTPPRSAQQYLDAIEGRCAEAGVGRIGTMTGRYFAMDRDQRWERVERAWRAMREGEGQAAATATAGLQAAYARDENDEFVQPTVVGQPLPIRDGDAVVILNFRADRARQLVEVFLGDDFDGFDRGPAPDVDLATMTRYREDIVCPSGFPPETIEGTFGEVVSQAGLSQLRIAETEKYAHVTYFFSGGDERQFEGERRELIPSPKVATYDLQPEMSADEVTDRLLGLLASDPPDVIVLNYANCDMVGHTGVLEAAVKAVQTIDRCLARLVPAILDAGGHVAITADHGNCEQMLDPDTHKSHTAHTTNKVPLVVAGPNADGKSLRDGRLCDIVTTLLPLIGLERSPAMTGENLLS